VSKLEDLMEAGLAVTVSRQMGSGGTYIGYRVANALGFLYVDRQILRRAASLLKRDAPSLEDYEETSSGIIQNLLRTFSWRSPENALRTQRTASLRQRPVRSRRQNHSRDCGEV
jgi:hypothetical protein